MPSRRNVLRGIGPALIGGVAGCLTSQGTTGTVARKQVQVTVPRTVGDPVTASLAVLTFESDGVVTGEYADIVSGVIDNASISVSETVHDRLADRFADVRYYSNIVPDDGSKPANGRVNRDNFNTLSVGGTATVDSVMKTVADGSSSSHLEIQGTTPRETPPTETRVSQYDWHERVDEIRGEE